MAHDRKAKPFPWRCPRCLKREVRPETIEYTTQVKHDGRLHEVALPELGVPQCSACGELVFCNDTNEQISRALRSKLGLLQPDEIRVKRRGLRLTQRALSNAIGVAAETISRWESGLLIQSRAMNNLMRIFFDYPEIRGVLNAGVRRLDITGVMTGWMKVLESIRGTGSSTLLSSIEGGLDMPATFELSGPAGTAWLVVTTEEDPVDTSSRMVA